MGSSNSTSCSILCVPWDDTEKILYDIAYSTLVVEYLILLIIASVMLTSLFLKFQKRTMGHAFVFIFIILGADS